MEGGLSAVRQIRNQLHSFSKKMAAPTKAMPVESEKRNHVKNLRYRISVAVKEQRKERHIR